MLGCCPKHLDENVSYRHVASFFKVKGGGQNDRKILDKQKNKNKRQLLENPQNPNTGGNFLSFTSIFTCSSKSVGAGADVTCLC